MTPLAMLVFGGAAYFMYRLRFSLLSLVVDWYNGFGIARALREKEERKRTRTRNTVQFFTVEQVWPDGEEEEEEEERESA